jgi:cytochrome c oxidase subunit 2
MVVSGPTLASLLDGVTAAQVSRDQVDVFNDIFVVFLALGTVVGIVVISYILYNVNKYRTDSSASEGEYDVEEEAVDESDVSRPRLGEIPTGTGKGGGKKLFMSFALSAVIVLSIVLFAYWNLLYVEGTPNNEDAMEVDVEAGFDGNKYSYQYTYPSGETSDTLVVPEGQVVELNVTSCDPSECPEENGKGNVWHTWTSPDLKASTDAIPGQYTQTWFQADSTGIYEVQCRELCGQGHSGMNYDEDDDKGYVEALSTDEFEQWCTDNNCMSNEEMTNLLNTTGGNGS